MILIKSCWIISQFVSIWHNFLGRNTKLTRLHFRRFLKYACGLGIYMFHRFFSFFFCDYTIQFGYSQYNTCTLTPPINTRTQTYPYKNLRKGSWQILSFDHKQPICPLIQCLQFYLRLAPKLFKGAQPRQNLLLHLVINTFYTNINFLFSSRPCLVREIF